MGKFPIISKESRDSRRIDSQHSRDSNAENVLGETRTSPMVSKNLNNFTVGSSKVSKNKEALIKQLVKK